MGRDPRRARVHTSVVCLSRPQCPALRARCPCRRVECPEPRGPGRVRAEKWHAVSDRQRRVARAGARSGAADLRHRRADPVQASDARRRAGANRQGLLSGVPSGSKRAGRARLAGVEPVRLVTFNDGLVGELRNGTVAQLDAPSMLAYFEAGQGARATGTEHALEEVTLRAPIIPKKFIHTAGNFREHEEESKVVDWSHEIAPWIVFFQNVDAIVGPDEPIVYPEHLTEELDYELELAVVIS